jgi:hypothetical protein
MVVKVSRPLPPPPWTGYAVASRRAKIDILIARNYSSRKLSNLHVALDAKLFIAGRYHSRLLDIVLPNLAAGRGIDQVFNLS